MGKMQKLADTYKKGKWGKQKGIEDYSLFQAY